MYIVFILVHLMALNMCFIIIISQIELCIMEIFLSIHLYNMKKKK